MSNEFNLNATNRDQQGKGASRRLRHTALVPAIVYGGDKTPQTISILFKDFVKALENEAFYSHVLNLNVDGQLQQVVLKALQRHPAKGIPLHADFLRVDATHPIHVRVPIHYLNAENAVGVKQQGGQVSIFVNEAEVSTLPANLPEYLEVDLLNVESGQVVHLSDIKLPNGVTLTQLALGPDHDIAIANIHPPKGGVEAEAAEA